MDLKEQDQAEDPILQPDLECDEGDFFNSDRDADFCPLACGTCFFCWRE